MGGKAVGREADVAALSLRGCGKLFESKKKKTMFCGISYANNAREAQMKAQARAFTCEETTAFREAAE